MLHSFRYYVNLTCFRSEAATKGLKEEADTQSKQHSTHAAERIFNIFLFKGATPLTGSSVVDGTGQIVLDDLRCTGSESRLIDCPHRGLGNHNCDHSKDAGVRCASGIKYNIVCSDVIIA